MKALLIYLFSFSRLLAWGLTEHQQVTLVADEANTADQFRVRSEAGEFVLRLYFVEAPHPAPSSEETLELEAKQLNIFGVADEQALREAAGQAMQALRSQLRRPFTVHVDEALPGGEDADFWGFVTTAGGADLSAYLVRAGHARVWGPGRDTPRGMSEREMRAVLSDARDAAMLERAGIWALTDPVRLPAMRAQQRRLTPEIMPEPYVPATDPAPEDIVDPAPETARSRDTEAARTPVIVNVNTADSETLQLLPGVDETLAGRIIRGRPYLTPRDLLDVRGIGVHLLESWNGWVVTR
ncbi:MAG: helix-hairpin-helix domain-containing protein [Verrucomicrobia bacterium]|nr:helix-hairpin-helix domain-containing protein [Verrucomicrobiota bacterium]MCH8513999.1 helix-hairpin-helix domain-containing protein [Kiritimatiellia bacterium]